MNWFWDKPRFGDYHEIYDLNMQPGDKITFWLLLLVLPPAMAMLLPLEEPQPSTYMVIVPALDQKYPVDV